MGPANDSPAQRADRQTDRQTDRRKQVSWDDIKSGGSGKFLKVEDGDTLQVFFGSSAPELRGTHWSSGRPTECSQDAECDPCNRGDKPQYKVEFMCVVVGEESEGDRAFGIHPMHALELKKLREKDVAKFERSIVMVGRKGTGKQTSYWFTIVGDYNPSEPF